MSAICRVPTSEEMHGMGTLADSDRIGDVRPAGLWMRSEQWNSQGGGGGGGGKGSCPPMCGQFFFT